ncbi:MAG: hypothetical protein ACYC1Q_07175 [Bacteroidia bacterium]
MKKGLSRLGLFFLIILASIGVGISGGVPLPSGNKKEEIVEVHAEVKDAEKDEATVTDFRV